MQENKPGQMIAFSVAENFRELGGYKNKDGKTVKHGAFYRTGMLNALCTKEDFEKFNSFGIKTIIDFRSESEIKQNPDPVFENATHHIQSALFDKDGKEMNFDLQEIFGRGKQGIEDMLASVHGSYTTIAFNNPGYKLLFKCIKNDELPLLFHCTAGKDRTGVAAALILRALNVDDEIIMQDYMLTNIYRDNTRADFIKKVGAIIKDIDLEKTAQAVLGVEEKALRATLKSIDEKYADFSDYLAKECDFSIEDQAEMRRRYLVD